MNILINKISDLTLEVYVIGYPQKGESQIVIIKDTTRVFYCCVIDCFEDNGKNITKDILNNIGIETINHFIWTHPDEDHSLGITDLIDNFCNGTTSFTLPEGLYDNEPDFINYNKNVRDAFDKLREYNSSRNYNVNSTSVSLGNHSQIYSILFIDASSIKLDLKAISIAPISAIVRRRWASGELKHKNDISIATIFQVGPISLLMGGDIENQTINLIPEHYFGNLSFIKTPHHTSLNTDSIIQKLNEADYISPIPIAVSTIFQQSKLPNLKLINQYKEYVDAFYSTGSGEDTYGIVKIVFDVVNNKIIKEELSGNSMQL